MLAAAAADDQHLHDRFRRRRSGDRRLPGTANARLLLRRRHRGPLRKRGRTGPHRSRCTPRSRSSRSPGPVATARPQHQLAHRDADQPAEDQREEQPDALQQHDSEAHGEPAGERRHDRPRGAVRAQADDRRARLPGALGALDADRRVDHAVGADRPSAVGARNRRLPARVPVADSPRGRLLR